EVRPDQRSVVHHAVIFIDPERKSLALDRADPGPGYTTSGGGVGFFPADGLGGRVPGNTPRLAPPGLGLKIPAAPRRAPQTNNPRDAEPPQARPRIGLHFAKAPIRQPIYTLPLYNLGFAIPPGAARHRVTASLPVPTDMTAWAVIPHMHLLGREMQV